MITRLPTDLPRFLAAVVGLSFLAWGFASIWAEAAVGRPSSTSALAYIFVPAWAGMLAAGGFVVGFVLRALVAGPAVRANPSRLNRGAALAILLVVPVLAAIHGLRGISRTEADARPRVLSSTPLVVREVVESRSPAGSQPAVLIWEYSDGAHSDSARKDLPTISFSGLSATFAFAGLRSEVLELPALDYVTSAYLLPLGHEGATRAYVAVINGRATGRRSVVAVLSADLRVLHAELVERWWQLSDNPLWAESSGREPSFERAILGCAGNRMITFRLNEQPNNEMQRTRPG